MDEHVEVIVVGAGNAAMCAALAARQAGAKVAVVESAPFEERGGNTRYAAGQMRAGFGEARNLCELVDDLDPARLDRIDIATYSAADFFDDVARLTQFRTDPELAEMMAAESFDTLRWMRTLGVRFQLSFGRQAHKIEGKFRFWGNLPCETWGGGAGMLEACYNRASRDGVDVYFNTSAVQLLTTDSSIRGLRVACEGTRRDIGARAVVLACGGFEANAEMRARYLGPDWDLAKVRGTRFNTGRGLQMALDAGARSNGHISGAHSTCWDLNAPAFGNLTVGDSYQKHSYPFGIMVNARGERFLDEGADFRNFTYAKYGSELLRQPGLFAWQIFDRRATALLRDEYRVRQVTKVTAATLPELAAKLEGVDGARFIQTVAEFNDSVPPVGGPVNPAIKDGRATRGLSVPKSNWAYPIDQPPFEAYAVTTGITFTFGGLKITRKAEVEDAAGTPIGGLSAAGEIVGGLFYHNYPGGSGLTAGAVFGRTAGREAAAFALNR